MNKPFKHSPGPWLFGDKSPCGTTMDVLNSDSSAVIATVACATDESDVCLIGFATEMFDLLQRYEANNGCDGHDCQLSDDFKALMKKIGGEV